MPDERDPRLLRLMHQFKDVFQEPKTLPPERIIEHHIELVPDAIPKKQHPYRYAYGQKTEIEKIVKDMLESGIIRTSQRSFASPVLLVKKKDGGWRLCVDYRSGYFQIRMKKEDIPKTSFITHSGLICVPCYAIWALQCSIYISGTNEPEKVLGLLREHQLYAKHSKCSFAQQQIDYLGHVISEEGVATDPQKIEYMKEWPLPTSIKALRGFLGLTGYYRKFIKGYGAISKPLTSLLKKDGFIWNPEAEAAFNHLKEVMTSVPVLALPNFSQPFVVETDAFGRGIGAVLMQKDIEGSYEGNTLFQTVVQAKVLDNQAFPDYSYEAGVLRRKGKICVGDVNAWVKECEVCQRAKHENNPYPGLLQPLPIPDQAWSCISMNFMKTFFDNIYKLHGLPVSIVTDRDRVFTSRFWKELFNMAGVSLEMSSAYHPDRWPNREGLKATPFQALYGYPPHQLTIGPYMQNHHSEVEELMQERVKVM
ncbi:UNVERIFIED_CONTAM: Retrovirus-related Pol polyprotein from transposon.6 [Sesamum latifolium]|uniref:Retrovirus-related Pol polyprotein from transposon.6 n=1 Tax=Sesamum latifolium TaxID=2727402 RepID=A0AAW2UVT4_9LAMI